MELACVEHCRCGCQEVARGFVGTEYTDISVYFGPGTFRTSPVLAHLILGIAVRERWFCFGLPFCK